MTATRLPVDDALSYYFSGGVTVDDYCGFSLTAMRAMRNHGGDTVVNAGDMFWRVMVHDEVDEDPASVLIFTLWRTRADDPVVVRVAPHYAEGAPLWPRGAYSGNSIKGSSLKIKST